ncbi:hypothetical protein HYS96_04325 [Candidatus Daviesbacteria bacterium]|nr:hypothetical protein [Candidatus Daviesbacteria bacterium]
MYLPISILAFILNGIAVTTDKFLLVKVIPDPLFYVFYFSLVSFLAVLLLPFTHIPTREVLLLSSASTVLWTLGAHFMFKALKVGQIERVIPVIGSVNPLILFLIALASGTILTNEIWGILVLILGFIFLTLSAWKGKIQKDELLFEGLSATLLALSYLILRQAYLRENFITVLVWSRFILIPVAIVFLMVPLLRSKVIPSQSQGVSLIKKGGLLFIIGQVSAGISQLLIFFAISLANPALVNSLQGIQYVFLFIAALLLSKKFPFIFKETYSKKVLLFKIFGILLIGLGLYTLAFSSG